ncbi:MAG: carboxypeptidase-like regulatory domain-containing protein, partial [Cyclobacteriaceae bacterium]
MDIIKKTTCLLLLLLFSIAGSWSQELALREENPQISSQKSSGSKSLKTAIKELEFHYKVSIVCNSDLLDTKIPVGTKFKHGTIENQLLEMFANSHLTFSKMGERFYVITDKKPEAVFVPKKNERARRMDFSAIALKKIKLDFSIRGKVTSEDGESLPGVTVLLKGTNVGSITDMDGNYSLNTPEGNGILVFSFIGYTSQEIPINGRSVINIALANESQALQEVVVTAFGLERKRESLVYSVTEVRGEEFTQSREINIANSLTGKIAGVNATSMASGPGSSSRVVIRGNGSLSGNNQPLYVINGMPISNSPNTIRDQANGATTDLGDGISSINPDDIETISVLKGGAAAALYGSQAA